MRFARTLRFRLTLWYSAALALVMVLFGASMYGIVGHRLGQHHDHMLMERAAEVQAVLRDQDDCQVLGPERTEALDHLGQIILVHEDGGRREVYYRSPMMRANPLAPALGALAWQPAGEQSFFTLSHGRTTWRVLSEPYQARSGRRGVIRVMDDLGEVQETLRHLRYTMLLLIPAGVLAAALGGLWLAGRALAPVAAVTRRAQEIEASSLDQRLPHPGVEDELGRLVDTLNRMIARLENAFHAMRRFTADASHELRNPLATLRNTIDVVLAQPRTVAEQREALESLGEDVDRLRRIVEDLLLLARADHGRLALEREPVCLAALVQALAETYQAQAQEQGVALETDLPAPARVRGDERWLYQLAGNLLDNALKFTPAGGRIQVAVRPEGAWARLTVRDSGPGIPAGGLERIFERFYQADPSRTRGSSPGSGLGLAIAAWIVEAHGGRITAANRAEGGAEFTVLLPLEEGDGGSV
jgi:heavy metal sensor kinase